MQEDFGISVSMHAISRYAERTGRGTKGLQDVYRDLKRAVNYDVEQWYDSPEDVKALGFSISYYRQGDRYAVWTDDITKEKLCAIVSADMNVITPGILVFTCNPSTSA